MRHRVRAFVREYWLALIAFVAFLAFWEFAVDVFAISPLLLPSPSQIGAKLVADAPLVRQHTGITLVEIGAGYLVAAAFGLGFGMLVVRFALVERILYPYVIASQTIPKIAIAPLIIIWFGVGLIPKVLIVATIAFFPITVNTVSGFRSVESTYLNLMHSVAASEMQVFRKLRFPYALPFIFAGLKLATTLSVLGAIVAEFMGASEGLGYLILSSTFNFEPARVFVCLLMLILIGVGFFGLIALLEGRLSWKMAERTRVVMAEAA